MRHLHRLNQWIRKTASSFAPLLFLPEAPGDDTTVAGDSRVYRLRHWPALPPCLRTARIYRVMSVMTQRPVNRRWLVLRQGIPPAQADEMLAFLMADNAVDVVDTAEFAATHP